jgi:translation initiation factor IF-2
MDKVRVYQLAKELRVQSALILELLDRMGQEVKSDLSTLSQDVAAVIRVRVTSAIDAERRRIAEHQPEAEATDVERTSPASEEAILAPPVEIVEPAESAADAVPPAPPITPAAPPAAAPPHVIRPHAAAPPPGGPLGMRRPRPLRPTVSASPEAGTSSSPSVGPGGPTGPAIRKPRVFPARRFPAPGTVLGRPKPAPTYAPPPSPARSPGTPPPAPAPTDRAPIAPKKPTKKEKKEREAVPMPARSIPKDLPPVPAEITLSEGVTVKELAEKLNRRSKDVIAKLISRGVLATINQPLDPALAIDVAKDFGSDARILTFEEEAQRVASPVALEPGLGAQEVVAADLRPRPPVVTVMGHVDHGKTSLLDAIRVTKVVETEAGGITQHIGAYQVDARGRKITFLDTPGHEAFTMMRARGAKATDIVVLVVAADDGVKPQTLEAIDHARAAAVPIVVAINKIDKPGANVDRVKQQLSERGLLVETYGGDVVSCEVSAKKRQGLDELLEMILLVADLKDLKAAPDRPAAGVVLEARLDRARGVLATVLVLEGTLGIGDPFIAGSAYGKVRAMVDDKGHRLDRAGPATPVEVMGFATEPGVGDSFQAVGDEARARQIAAFRQEKLRAERQRVTARRTLESLAHEIATGEVKELPILLKADVQGSLEALQKTLADLPSDKVRISILRSSIGAITQADVLLAAASNAIVVGFNVRPDRTAADLAKEEHVELRLYTVIYDLVDDMKKAMLGLLEPTFREKVLGQAEVRQLFRVPRIGVIAGCYIIDGKIARSSEVRLLRDNVVVYTGRIGSLRRFKDDVSEVKQGYECGIGIEGYNDLKESDVIESFVMEKVLAESL